jgi:ATP-binding cassette, subfamily B, bacterial
MQKQIISLFWRTAMKYPLRTILAIIGSAGSSVTLSFIAPFVIAQLLEKLQAGNLTLEAAGPYLIAYVIMQITAEVIGWRLVLYFIWTMETAGQRDLYQRIFTTLTNQSLAFHANRFGGALVSQTTKLVGAFERFWDTIVFQLTPVVSGIAAAIIIMSFIFWQYAVVLGIVTIVFIVAVYLGSRFMVKRNREEAQANTATNAYVADSVTNIALIKAHSKEAFELDALTDRAVTWRQKSLSTMRGFLTVSGTYATLMATLNITALIAAIWASEHHLISIGVVYLSVSYTLTVSRQLWEMNNIMRNYNRIMGDAHDMTEILLLNPSVIDQSDKKLKAPKGSVVFNKITFTHDGGAKPLFDDFHLDIKSGERIGLVGHSGSGKTTLTRLLLRFSDLEEGEITIDGQDISQITQDSLRDHIAYVPQEPMLFHRTLRENIAYGKPDATDAQIKKAITQANAVEFIDTLPQGLDTLVGERGVKLSGGQRQRIAIARAILKDAPILVLDEATSALDSESEKLIQDALGKLMKNRTSIVIAHRLSTIAKLDRIVVLDNGKITEDGTHNELLKKKGTYASLWSHQSGGFIED